MKFTFQIQYAQILSADKIHYISMPVGGALIPEDGKTGLQLTPYYVIQNHRDKQADCMQYIGGFFGGYPKTDNGYIGKWTDDVDKESYLYYQVQDGVIYKMLIAKHMELGLVSIGGLQYIVNIDGNMTDCVLEDGDIIFDNEEEANKYKNELSVKDDKN